MANDSTIVVDPQSGDQTVSGNLFAGIKFFVLQRVPLRRDLVNQIVSNGGSVVKHEEAADYVIADHVRKDCPPGSISWTFIESSFRAKTLADPETHRIGPKEGMFRVPGSGAPGKNTRTPFTADDDRFLWNWVEDAKSQGALIRGNEVYKQLEAVNPRHTYQAWRDRYLKRLIDRPPADPQAAVLPNVPSAPPPATDRNEDQIKPGPPKRLKMSPGDHDGQIGNKDYTHEQYTGQEQNGLHYTVANEQKLGGPNYVDREAAQETSALQYAEPRQRPKGSTISTKVSDSDRNHLPRQPNLPEYSSMVEQHMDDAVELTSPKANKKKAEEFREQKDIMKKTRLEKPYEKQRGTHAVADLHTPRVRLTKANLASQQAQQNGKPIRGADLPEDDPDEDQSDFVKFLSSTIGQDRRVDRVSTSDPDEPGENDTPVMASKAARHESPSDSLLESRSKMPRAHMAHASLQRLELTPKQKRSREPPSPELADMSAQTEQASHVPTLGRSWDDVTDAQDVDQDDIDLTIPSPEGGWGFNSPQEEVNSVGDEALATPPALRKAAPSLSATQKGRYQQGNPPQGHALDTQDMVNAETQVPDLYMPYPPDSDEESPPGKGQRMAADPARSLPASHAKANTATATAIPAEDLSNWAEKMRGRGYTPVSIISALKVSSVRTDLAELVLLEERSGRGLPKDVPGIWSEGEDLTLESGNAKGLLVLEEKHGWDECKARMQYLTDGREV